MLSRRCGRGGHPGRFFGGITGREYGITPLADRPFVNDFDCGPSVGSGCFPVAPHGTRTPAFSLKFSNHAHGSKLLAVADEEGYIHVINADMELPDDRSLAYDFEEPPHRRPWLRHSWQAHYNAVFDVMWSHDDQHILTASGDQTMGMWDVEANLQTHSFRGHSGSVKSMSQSQSCSSVFASGGRDGAVALWDARLGITSGPVHRIDNAHVVRELVKRRGRRPGVQGDSKQSVTSVLFLKADEVLATAGAADGVVKFWDARNLSKPTALLGLDKDMGEDGGRAGKGGGGQPATLSRRHGITCMDEDPAGGRLLVSHSNSLIYVYDALRPEKGPVTVLGGHRTTSFYVKAAFSPDGTHVVSGSSDRNVCLWSVDRGFDWPYTLKAHTGEVTGVAWCPQDFGHIASCADDATVRLWKIRRPEGGSKVQPQLWMPCRARVQADPPAVASDGGKGSTGGHGGGEEAVGDSVPSTTMTAVDDGAGEGVGAENDKSGDNSGDESDEGEGGGVGGSLGKRKRTLKDYWLGGEGR